MTPSNLLEWVEYERNHNDEVCPADQQPCVVCMVNKKKFVYNCGHLCCCIQCDDIIMLGNDQCPVCRAAIIQRTLVYN